MLGTEAPWCKALPRRGWQKRGTSTASLANEDVIAAALANRKRVLVLPTPVLPGFTHPLPNHLLEQQGELFKREPLLPSVGEMPSAD